MSYWLDLQWCHPLALWLILAARTLPVRRWRFSLHCSPPKSECPGLGEKTCRTERCTPEEGRKLSQLATQNVYLWADSLRNSRFRFVALWLPSRPCSVWLAPLIWPLRFHTNESHPWQQLPLDLIDANWSTNCHFTTLFYPSVRCPARLQALWARSHAAFCPNWRDSRLRPHPLWSKNACILKQMTPSRTRPSEPHTHFQKLKTAGKSTFWA